MSHSPFTRSLIANEGDIKLLDEYLDKRTLEPKDFPQGLVPFREIEMLRSRNYAFQVAAGRPFIFLRYLNAHGEPYYKNKDPYEQAKFLGEPKMWRGKDDPPKAISQNGRAPVLHFEPLLPHPITGDQRDWFSLPDGTTVVHLESMIKAKAVHKWLPLNACVGLTGVWGWTSSKSGVELTHADTGVDFSRFRNVILFDSNVLDPKKPDIEKARHALAFKLRNVLGCKEVYLADLPRPSLKEWDGKDWGPDDFLRVRMNPEELQAVIDNAVEFVASKDDDILDRVRQRAVYCTQTGAFIDRNDKVVRDLAKARELYMTVNRKDVSKGGAVRMVYGFELWRNDGGARKEVMGPCYLYEEDEFVEKTDGTYYNIFKKSGIDRAGTRTGAADPVIAHLERMLNAEGLYRLRTYLKFLKFNSAKPCTLLVLHGLQRGVGKGWVTKIAHRLIGDSNTGHARGKDLSSNFNALLQAKRLLIFNEFISEGSWKNSVNTIKGLAGDEFITIEPKGMDAYKVENRAGAIFTTNNVTDVPADGLEDRRLIYMKAELKEQLTQPEWDNLHAMIDRPDVMEDFAQWLWEADDINYSSWRPDPQDPERRQTLLGATKGIEGALLNILERVKNDEGGWVCCRIETIQMLLEQDGWSDRVSNQHLSMKLNAIGWAPSTVKNYGSNGFQRCVWLIDPLKFEEHESDRAWVMQESARTHEWVTGMKVDIKKF